MRIPEVAEMPLLLRFSCAFWCCLTIDPEDTTTFVLDCRLPYELEARPLNAPAMMSC